MMEILSLEDGGTHPTYRIEAMEYVVVRVHCGQLPVEDTCCVLPHNLH